MEGKFTAALFLVFAKEKPPCSEGNHMAVMLFMAAVSAACVLLMLFAKETKLSKQRAERPAAE